jgi:hypothetical protein
LNTWLLLVVVVRLLLVQVEMVLEAVGPVGLELEQVLP